MMNRSQSKATDGMMSCLHHICFPLTSKRCGPYYDPIGGGIAPRSLTWGPVTKNTIIECLRFVLGLCPRQKKHFEADPSPTQHTQEHMTFGQIPHLDVPTKHFGQSADLANLEANNV